MALDGRSRGDRPRRELDAPEVWQLLVTSAPAVFNAMRSENPQQMIDISDEDVVGFQLAGIDLHNANLFQTNFRDCDLAGADFRGAKLELAKFFDCKLKGARFDDNEGDATFENCSR